MAPQLAVRTEKTSIARPLKVLIPLIHEELSAGHSAGLEHYRQAGEMLLEARQQVAAYKWGAWLSKNFELSRTTAFRYMKLAEIARDRPDVSRKDTNLHEVVYGGKNSNESRAAWRRIAAATRNVDREEFTTEHQSREDEVRLHRELAGELIDIGYRALATRLHPDRGGSKEAMTRLNRVRDELKSIAETRRFM